MLVVTSDLPEALRIADRLQVVRGGTTTVEFGPDATQVDVLAAAAGAGARGRGEDRMTATLTSPPVQAARQRAAEDAIQAHDPARPR